MNNFIWTAAWKTIYILQEWQAKFGLGTSESVGTFICDWLALLERLLIGCFKTKKNPSDQSEQRLRLSLANEKS